MDVHCTLYTILLTVNTSSERGVSRLYQNPLGEKIQTKPKPVSVQIHLYSPKSFTKWRIKSINNFAIHSKLHLNNRVYIFTSIYNVLNHQTLKPLNTPFSLRHEKLVSYIIKHLITLKYCHLCLTCLYFITGLKYIN